MDGSANVNTSTRVATVARIAPLIALMAALFGQPAFGASEQFDTQVSREAGIMVEVTPHAREAGTDTWEFEVAFNTHSGSLDGNPADASVLLDGQGNEYPAVEWDGSASGGHHLRGVLRFRVQGSPTMPIELRIGGVGSMTTRTFQWN